MPIRTVLLIDDDKDDQHIFKEALRSIDPKITCETAENGQVAINLLARTKVLPDIAFVDLNMPVMDGYGFLRYRVTNERLQRLRVGIFSTAPVLTEMKTSKGLGASFYLTKPGDFPTLCAKLRKILSADYAANPFTVVI
jgi:CheY-like chemotaxis protein